MASCDGLPCQGTPPRDSNRVHKQPLASCTRIFAYICTYNHTHIVKYGLAGPGLELPYANKGLVLCGLPCQGRDKITRTNPTDIADTIVAVVLHLNKQQTHQTTHHL